MAEEEEVTEMIVGEEEEMKTKRKLIVVFFASVFLFWKSVAIASLCRCCPEVAVPCHAVVRPRDFRIEVIMPRRCPYEFQYIATW